jgi:hypothetical protein
MSESGSWAEYQKLVLKLLEQHDEKLEKLQQELTSASADRVILTQIVAGLKDEIAVLVSIVKEGTLTDPSLTERISKLEVAVHEIKEDAKEAKKLSQDRKRERFAIMLAVVGSAIAIVWDVISKIF